MSSHLQYHPLPWPLYAFLFFAVAVLTLLIQIGLLRYVYSRLGITPAAAVLLLLASLLGGYVNIPIAYLPDEIIVNTLHEDPLGFEYVVPEADWSGTIIAINVGGAVIPILLSIYLLAKNRIWIPGLIATGIMTAICHALAQPVAGAGIAIPVFIPPIAACLVACVIAWADAPAVAYVSGSLGTLIGADLLNLDKIRGLGTPVASIGGAGTFDGIFVTGLFAVVLASLIGSIGAHRAAGST